MSKDSTENTANININNTFLLNSIKYSDYINELF